MPGEAAAISQGLNIIGGGIQLFSNLAKEKRAKQELAQLRDPFYKIQDEYVQNRNLAGTAAQGGLPAAELDYVTNQSQRGLGAAISGGLQAGATANDIGKYFSIYNNSIDKTAAESADQHLKNIQYYQGVNKDLAGQKNIQFGFNEVRPYERNYKRLMQEKSVAEQNAWNGLDKIVGTTSAVGASGQNNDLLAKLFAEDTSSSSSGFLPTRRGSLLPDNNLPMGNF